MALNPRFFTLSVKGRDALHRCMHASVRQLAAPAAGSTLGARSMASSAAKGGTPSEWMGERLRAAVPPDPSGFAGQGEAAKKGAAGMDRISGPMNSLGAAVREGAAAAGYKPAQELRGVGSTAGAVTSAPSDDYDYRKDPMQFEFDRPDRSTGDRHDAEAGAGAGSGMGIGGRSVTGFGLRDAEGPPRAANSSSGDDNDSILRDPMEQEFDRPVLDMPTRPAGPQASVGQPTRPGKAGHSSSAGMRHMYHTSAAVFGGKTAPGMGEGGRAPHLAGDGGEYEKVLGDDNSANLSGKLKGSDTKGKGADWDTKSVDWLDQQLRASGSDPSTMANTWTGGKDPMRPQGNYGTVGVGRGE